MASFPHSSRFSFSSCLALETEAFEFSLICVTRPALRVLKESRSLSTSLSRPSVLFAAALHALACSVVFLCFSVVDQLSEGIVFFFRRRDFLDPFLYLDLIFLLCPSRSVWYWFSRARSRCAESSSSFRTSSEPVRRSAPSCSFWM